MAELESTFIFGDKLKEETGPETASALFDSYRNIAAVVNSKPSLVFSDKAPTSSDINFSEGTFWVDQNADKLYFLIKITGAPPSATWVVLN